MTHTEDIIREVVLSIQTEGIPHFMFGNPIVLSNSIVREKSVSNKYPVVIMMDDISEKVVRSNTHPVDRVASIQMFFMQKANPKWTSIEHMDNAVKPMRQIKSDFLDALNLDYRVQDIEEVDTKVHTNWGLKVEIDGKRKSVFPDWLSGIELTFDVKVFKPVKCRNN